MKFDVRFTWVAILSFCFDLRSRIFISMGDLLKEIFMFPALFGDGGVSPPCRWLNLRMEKRALE